jgi:hypothetical protein
MKQSKNSRTGEFDSDVGKGTDDRAYEPLMT